MSASPFLSSMLEDLKAGKRSAVAEQLHSDHPHRIAEALDPCDDQQIWHLLQCTTPEAGAEIFAHLPMDRQVRLLQRHPLAEVVLLVGALPPDERADVVAHLPGDRREEILGALSSDDRLETEELGRFPQNVVGAWMSTDFASVRSGTTIAQCMDNLRTSAPSKETIYTVYVVDDNGKLTGAVSLKDLITHANQQDSVDTVARFEIISVTANQPREEAVQKIKDFDLLALPVVNARGALVGIVTVDDLIDAQEAEITEDFHHMAPVNLGDITVKQASWTKLFIARSPWLLILVFMNIFSGAGIAYFEDTIEAVVALVFFLPLLIDSGGNAGSQAATLMVRSLAVGDVKIRDWSRLLGKEIGVSLALGIAMALAVASIAAVRAPEILVPVALTMVCTVVFGSVIGMSLPFLLTKLGRDPATASAPLITSIADIGGVLIFFGIATAVLDIDGMLAESEAEMDALHEEIESLRQEVESLRGGSSNLLPMGDDRDSRMQAAIDQAVQRYI